MRSPDPGVFATYNIRFFNFLVIFGRKIRLFSDPKILHPSEIHYKPKSANFAYSLVHRIELQIMQNLVKIQTFVTLPSSYDDFRQLLRSTSHIQELDSYGVSN